MVDSGRIAVEWVATVSGDYEIAIMHKGAHIPGSPFLVSVDHGVITPALSEVRYIYLIYIYVYTYIYIYTYIYNPGSPFLVFVDHGVITPALFEVPNIFNIYI